MDPTIIIAIINGVVAIAGLLASAFAAYLAFRAKELGLENRTSVAVVSHDMAEVKSSVEVIHKATNSMKDELVAEVRKAARAEGVVQGTKDAKDDLAVGVKKAAEDIVQSARDAKDELVHEVKKVAGVIVSATAHDQQDRKDKS